MSHRKHLFVLSLMLWSISGALCMAQGTASSTMITLNRPVHFSAGAGGELIAAPGDYTVFAVENSRLLLIPEKGTVPLLIQAQTTSHEENITSPQVRSIPGEGDEHHIMVLLPRGQGRDAVGFYSDLRARAASPASSPNVEKGTVRELQPPALGPPPPTEPASPVPGLRKSRQSSTPSPKPLPPQDDPPQVLSAVQNLDGRLGSLEGRLDAIERLLSALESKLASQFDALDRKLEELKK